VPEKETGCPTVGSVELILNCRTAGFAGGATVVVAIGATLVVVGDAALVVVDRGSFNTNERSDRTLVVERDVICVVVRRAVALDESQLATATTKIAATTTLQSA
jgi:hypothetical protein